MADAVDKGPGRGRGTGIAVVTVATVLWSTAGLFVRALDLDVWTTLGWRSVFAAIALFITDLVRRRKRVEGATRKPAWLMPLAMALSGLSMFGYVASLKLTTVANVLTIYATIPFVAAGVAFLWTGERAERRIVIASGVALAGVAVMAWAAASPRDLAGNALAFLMTVTFAMLLVMARRYPDLRLAAINAGGAALCAAVCFPLMPQTLPSPLELAILAAFGLTTTALAYVLFLLGARYIPAPEAGLIGLLDVVLGPLWVWLAFSENPGRPALVGGVIVIAAVLWYLSAGLRQMRNRRAPGQPAL
ncbi:EamA domain-containing membrane protein RarD [Faunimonas pinastri]|uniref:EamA domain-containing membrane protein RarD n=1 Tax=Faunimonas pinastri TaxID=1855383 RepID=A0A1H9HPN2_9HYPH|nr:DMT family transporter [Faunimonas pinastri]SEQ64299.1 EamA domain-containing membrane protein RarD [Faunimonas pinastri]